MTTLTITLPWPSSVLSPNGRAHWTAKQEAKCAARDLGYSLAHNERMGLPKPLAGEKFHLRLVFHPPDKKYRDLDNMLASIKSCLDGVCVGIGIDDSQIKAITMQKGLVVAGGAVRLSLEPI